MMMVMIVVMVMTSTGAVLTMLMMMVMIMMAYIVIRVKLNPKLVPELPPKPTGKELWHGLIDMFPFLILMGSILGSIYGGYATPTEAAALSVVLAAVLTVVYHCFRIRDIFDAAVAAAKGSAMVFFIIFGAQLFTTLISKAGISRGLVAWFKELQPTKLVLRPVLHSRLPDGRYIDHLSDCSGPVSHDHGHRLRSPLVRCYFDCLN